MHAVVDRGGGWHLGGSSHIDTVRVVGQLEWIKASLLERLLGREP